MTDIPASKEMVSAERSNGAREVRPVREAIAVLDTGRFDHMWRVATAMARTTLVPDGLSKTKDGDTVVALPFDTIVANCFLVVNQAERWGMDPFAVMQCVSVVHGKLCYEGKLVHAVIEAKIGTSLDYVIDAKQGDAMGIVISGTLPDGRVRTVKGTVGGWKTHGKNSPWVPAAYERQLRYRGAREWARAWAPGVMLGVYAPDEMDDLVARRMVDVTPRGAEITHRPKGPPPAPPVHQLDLITPAADPEPARDSKPSTTTINARQSELFTDPATYLDHLAGMLAACADKATLDEAWTSHLETSDGRLSSEDEAKCDKLYKNRAKQVG